MSKQKKQEKKLKKDIKVNNNKVVNFLGINKEISDTHINTNQSEELYFIRLTPKNFALLSDNEKNTLVEQFSSLLGCMSKAEIVCLDSTQNYDTNKNYIQKLAQDEKNPVIKNLDEQDITYLDEIKYNMATSRAFFLVVRIKNYIDTPEMRLQSVQQVINKCSEFGFDCELADKETIKKHLAIYLSDDVYTDSPPDYDGEQYGLDKEKYRLKDFVDIVAPSVLDFKHPKEYVIGNTYRTALAIRTYATTTTSIALLKELGEQDGVNIHIYTTLLTEQQQNKIFNVANRRNKSQVFSSRDATEKVKGQTNLDDINIMISEAYKNKEAFLSCAVFIEIMAKSREKLKNKLSNVKSIFSREKIVSDDLYLQQRDGFISAAPFGFNIFNDEFERVLPAKSVANLFPLSYSGKTDKTGFYLGRDANGSNIITDFDKRAKDKTNGHIGIFGNSGEGKSYLIKGIITIFRQQKKNVYSLDVDNEFIDLTHALGGTTLSMMTGKYIINPLQVKINLSNSDDDNASDDSAPQKNTSLSLHIAYLLDFFKVYKPEISGALRDILEIMLSDTYKRFHINDNTDFSQLSNDKYPILSDLHTTVERALNSYDDLSHRGIEMKYRKEDLRSLLLALDSICVGTDSKFFNGTTNIPNGEHINFCIKELLSTNDNLKGAMYLNIFSFIQNKFFDEGNTVAVFDELHELIKTPVVLNYIRSFIKRGRKKNSDVVVASQNLDDLMLPDIIEYTRPLFSIPTHLFLFYPGNVNIKLYMETTNISETEYNAINSSHRGRCLYLCGSEKYQLDVIVPKYKNSLFGTAGGN